MKMLERLQCLLLNVLSSKIARITIDFIVIVLIGLLVFRNFLFSCYWPAGGDVLGWISRVYLFGHDLRWTYTWRPHSFGFPENIYLIDFFYMLLYNLLKDPVFLIKLVMFLSFIFSGFSAYIFAFKYTSNNLASFSAALIYMLNQWLASQLTEAHVDILISYAIFPIIFLLFDLALENGSLKRVLLLSLGLTVLVTGFHPECTVIYGTFIFIFLLVYVIYPSSLESFSLRLKKTIKVTSISFVTCFLLSAFFTVPFISNINAPYFSQEYSYFLEETYGLTYRNLTDALSLRAIENWGYVNVVQNVYYKLALPNFPIYTLLCFIFTVALIITLIFRMNHRTVFFTIATFLSVIIAMGPYSIFWAFFIWGWMNIPHFAVFRAASRWIMMAALSYAYFISMLVSVLTAYLKGRHPKFSGFPLNLNIGSEKKRESAFKKVKVLVKPSDFTVKAVSRILRTLSVFLIITILVSGFISCAFLFSYGLQVYAPPKSYLEPYDWISQQKGDFKIVTVNSPEVWLGPNAQSDFSFSGMLTDVGWWHDIGHDSPFLHDKPTLQNGGWDFSCRAFVDYLRFHVGRQTLTNKMLKILGTFGYKYVVIPPYATGKEREFFLNQKGIQIVYNNSNSLILRNNYYVPRVFAVRNYSTIVGGLGAFLSLLKIDDFNFSRNALVFANKNENLLENGLLENSDFLIFVNGHLTDLTMLTMKDSLIKASAYGVRSWNITKYWISWPSWRTVGRFVYWGDILTTCGENTVKIPFYVQNDGDYYIWVRVGFAPNRGKLTITVDDKFQTCIWPQAKFWSELKWINLTQLNLRKGYHVITLKNDGTGFNDVDSIAVTEVSRFHQQSEKILESIENSKSTILYLLEAEINFLENPNSIWNYEQLPYHDYVVFSEGTGRNIAPLGNVSASSESDQLVAENAVDENPTTRWASLKGLPQWIQIEWNEKQRIRGVKILFEWAYARDYSIQVWNGTTWVNQLIVKGNNEYEKLHFFTQTVETNKIRIYFMNAPAYDMVSIWELKVYSEKIATEQIKLYIPREGNYQFFARVLKNPQRGILHLKVDDVLFNASCYAENSTFEWLNLGEIYLNQGEHKIGVGATGNVKLDMIAVVSTKGNIHVNSLEELFRGDSENPPVSFERINPCKYKVHVNAETPFILVFSDAYHSSWKAFLKNGTEIPSTNLYHTVNGFFINETGELDITIYFTGQELVDLGYKISVTTFSVIVVLLVLPKNLIERLKREMASKFKR